MLKLNKIFLWSVILSSGHGFALSPKEWEIKLRNPLWKLFSPAKEAFNKYVAEKFELPDENREKHIQNFLATSCDHANRLDKFNVTVLVEQTSIQNSEAPDITVAGSQRPVSLKSQIEAHTKRKATFWDYTLFSSIFLANAIFRLDDDGKVPFYGYRMNDGIPQFDQMSMHDVEQIYRWFQKVPSGESNMIMALNDAFRTKLLKFDLEQSPETHLFIVFCVSKPKNTKVQKAIKNLIKRNLTSRDPKGKYLHLLLIPIREDKDLKAFCADLDEDPEVGGNVDTKSLKEVLDLGPECILVNSIFEHLDRK